MRDVYTIIEGKPDQKGEKNSFWHKVGIAFDPNRDGSINIKLFALPVNGKLQIRDQQKNNEESENAERESGQDG